MKFSEACMEASMKMVSYPDRRVLEQLSRITTISIQKTMKDLLADRPRRELELWLRKK